MVTTQEHTTLPPPECDPPKPRKHINVLILDGPWSWVVCLANFTLLLNAATFGRAISINFLNFAKVFDSSVTVTSLIFTFHLISISLSAVLGTTVLVPLTGERIVCVVGTLGCALSTVGISLAPNIGTFLFFMTLKGACVGTSFVPAISMISQYFDKRRSLATALANCGLSLGAIGTPPLLDIIDEEYGLRGSFLILAALEMQSIPVVIFLRPISSYTVVVATLDGSLELHEHTEDNEEQESFGEEEPSYQEPENSANGTPSCSSSHQGVPKPRGAKLQPLRLTPNNVQANWKSSYHNFILPTTPIDGTKIELDGNLMRAISRRHITDARSANDEDAEVPNSDRNKAPLKIRVFETSTPSEPSPSFPDVDVSQMTLGYNMLLKRQLARQTRGRSVSEEGRYVERYDDKDLLPLSARLPCDCKHKCPLLQSHHSLGSNNSSKPNSPFIGRFKMFNFSEFSGPSSFPRSLNDHMSSDSTQHRKRACHGQMQAKSRFEGSPNSISPSLNTSSWSLVSTPSQIPVDVEMFAYQSQLNTDTSQNDDTTAALDIATSGQDGTERTDRLNKNVKQNIIQTFNVQILRSWAPLTLFASSVVGVLVQYVVTYLPTIAAKAQLSGGQISLLLTISGILDLVSRLALGAFMDTQILKPSTSVALSQLIMGTLCFLGALYTNYNMLIFLAVMTGLFAGARQTLGTLLTIQFLGAQDFLKALGFQTMFGTLSLAAHHPLLSAVLEATGSFVVPLHYVGVALYVSSVLLLLEPLVKTMDKKSKNNKGDLP